MLCCAVLHRAAGPAAEAQEPTAALPGPPEAEALASAAGPEKEQALSMPRDATADLWLREGAWGGTQGLRACVVCGGGMEEISPCLVHGM